jgi:hypothetical protein
MERRSFATSKNKHRQAYCPPREQISLSPPRLTPLVQRLGRVCVDLRRGHPAVTKHPLAREPLAQAIAS